MLKSIGGTAMSFFYFMGSACYGEALKKILSCEAGFSAYEHEYTYHLVCLNNAYYSNVCTALCCRGVCCNSPYREEKG